MSADRISSRAALRFVWAESRGARGRLAFAATCIALGVFAVVGVAALADAIESNVRARSRELIAADLRISGRHPVDRESFPDAREFDGVERTYVQKLATMVAGTDAETRTQLVDLKVVDGDFPLRGEMELEPAQPAGEAFDDWLSPDRCVIAPELASAFGVGVGDSLSVGGAPFTVAAVVLSEPDKIEFEFALGPRVFLSYAGFERTGLHLAQNRVQHQLLFRFDELPSAGELDREGKRLAELHVADSASKRLTIDDAYQSRGGFRRGLERVERGLGLFALLSLLLGGAGVAGIVRRLVAERTASIAILRAMGVRPREVLLLYLGMIVALALLGSLVGALAGSLVPGQIVRFIDVVEMDLKLGFEPWAFLRGLALGGGVALAFALLPLTAIYSVPPARVLDSRVEPLPTPRFLAIGGWTVLIVALFLAAWWQADRARDGAFFGAGVALLAGLLWFASWLLQLATRHAARWRLPLPLRHGLAALARPGSDARSATVALGIGILSVLAVFLVERRLVDQLAGTLPDEAPSAFLTDVQPSQWETVRTALVEAEAKHVQSVPVVMGRIKETAGGTRDNWQSRREQRLTWMNELGPTNTIVEGELWAKPDVDEVSIEVKFAEEIGATLGSKIVFDVQGVPIELEVTSLREVEWQSFAINFFLVVEPGVLDDAPHFRIAAAQLTRDGEREVSSLLAREAPNVTVYWVRDLVDRALGLMNALAKAVQVLGLFAVFAGLLILAGSIAAGALERTREVALLKALGMIRRGLLVRFGVEFALIGFAAALLGAGGAALLAWAFFNYVLEIGFGVPWSELASVVPLAGVASAVVGLLASGQALRTRPLATLRSR